MLDTSTDIQDICKEAVEALTSQCSKCSSIADFVNLAYSFRYKDISIEPIQIKDEFYALREILWKIRPKTLLEIGTANGGTLFLLSKIASDDGTIISVDLPGGSYGGGYPDWKVPLYESFASSKQKIHLIRADSHDKIALDKVIKILGQKRLDFLFINGDHTYDGVKKDFEMYAPLVADEGIIAFHDIVIHPLETGAEVHRFWNEIRDKYKYVEMVKSESQNWAGIGLLFKSTNLLRLLSLRVLRTLISLKDKQISELENTIDSTRLDPMGNLLSIYYLRKDLQINFPEVANGDYSGLLSWAKEVCTGADDSAKEKLSKFSNWYISKALDLTSKVTELQNVLRKVNEQVSALTNELANKDEQLRKVNEQDYIFRRVTGKILDYLLPTSTSRGKYKKVIVASYWLIKTTGFRYFSRLVLEKIKRREFLLAEDIKNYESAFKTTHEWDIDISWLSGLDNYGIKNYNDFLSALKPEKKVIEEWKNTGLSLSYKPLISILMPVYNPKLEWLRESIESVLRQVYENFELAICDDGSDNVEAIKRVIAQHNDARIKFRTSSHGGIVSAINKAYDLTSGKYIAFLDQDDLLFPNSLLEVAIHLNGFRADILYTDEVKFDPSNCYLELARKRDFSFRPLWLSNFISHLTVISRRLVDHQLLTPGYDFAQDYEMLLRLCEKTDKIVYMRRYLYAWRIHENSTSVISRAHSKLQIYVSAKNALRDSLRRQGLSGIVKDGQFLGQHIIKNLEIISKDPENTINFILPGIRQSGGVRSVFSIANELKLEGLNTNIIFPKIPYTFSEADAKESNIKISDSKIEHILVTDENDFNIRANLLRVPYICDKFVPDAIATVASAWPTAYSVNELSSSKGKKFYLIQHYETWQGPKETVDDTYRLGLKNIIIADWLGEKIKELGGKIAGKITMGYDNTIFFRYPNKKENEELRILMQFRPEQIWKGSKDGIEAFKIARNKCPNIKLVTYGMVGSLLDVITGKRDGRLMQSHLRDLHNSCDIVLFPSWYEGCPLPPMEAMACGLTLVTTDCTGISEYAVDNVNSLISPVQNPPALAANLERIVKNRKLREELRENGFRSVQHRTLDKTAQDFLQIVRNTK